MTRDRRTKDSLSNYRAEVDRDDGAIPRDFFKKETSAPSRSGRKAQQLCAQVAATLDQIFSGECGDAILQSLRLVEVTPAPDASQMLVVVCPLTDAHVLPQADVLDALHRASGWLRTEIAAAITRKRMPRLVFRYLPVSPAGEVQP